jgi:hypothetical protein
MRTAPLLALLLWLPLAAHATPRLLGPPIHPGDAVDYQCARDADCAIKDVGNCCGAWPACVNRDSPTFPERVRKACVANHAVGTCGFPVVRGCRCVEGRCSDVTDGHP